MKSSARLTAAIDLLADIEGSQRRPADAVANQFFRDRRYIGSGDRRAVSDRVWRVLRARRRLGWWLERAGATSSPRLLVAASLMLEGWNAAGLGQSFSGGQFAPPPLEARERQIMAKLEGHDLAHPAMPDAVRLEVPDWILPMLQARFGPALDAEMAALNQPAPLDLRVNLLKATRDEARVALQAEGLVAEPTPLSPWGLRIPQRLAVTTGATFQNGLVEIQDEGSQLIALVLGAEPGMRVADWCAGAGGKTLAIAAAMRNRGFIAACDVSAPRLDGAIRRLRRAGIHNVERHLIAPGDKWPKRRAGSFDRVLVDAPCTGTGTWRRNPDGRLRLREIDLQELVVKQAAILDAAAKLVEPGGWLVYSTCSLLSAENQDQVGAFLARTPGFTQRPVAVGDITGEVMALTPLQHGTDGFFAAVLEREAASAT